MSKTRATNVCLWVVESDPIHTGSCRHHGSSLALKFFLIRNMVSEIRGTKQKCLQPQKKRARLNNQPRDSKAYQLKKRDRQRKDRVNSTIRFEAKPKAVTKHAAQAQTERIRQILTAQSELLRVQTASHARQMEKCKEQVRSERVKAQAAVASIAQKWKDGMTQQANAYDSRLREKGMLYKSGGVKAGKRSAGHATKAELWETWWSRLPVQERQAMLRVTRSGSHGSLFWFPRLHG